MSYTIKINSQFLPKNVKFKEGEVVDWGGESLKERSEMELKVNLVEELNILPKDIFKHLKVSLGEKVEPEQTLAEKKSFMKKSKFKAPEAGEVRGIDHLEGTLTLAVEKVIEVPFAIKLKFSKHEDNDYYFKAAEGLSVPVGAALETSFGGETSYVEEPTDLKLENCDNKVLIMRSEDIMDHAKAAALSPIALVAFGQEYLVDGLPYLRIEKKEDWREVLTKKYRFALYLSEEKQIYFYNP